MTVTLTSEAVGKQPGETYTGPLEDWLLSEGYASKANYGDKSAAVLTGGSNAANIVTGGNLVIATKHKTFTIALATSDTPSAAAGKIDTALAGYADAAITSSKLVVTTTATGNDSGTYLRVISGTGTVLANLGLTAGQRAVGATGGVGTANTGATSVSPAKDPTLASNREDPPSRNADGTVDPGPRDPAMGYDDSATDDDFDFDQGGVNDDAPRIDSVSPANLLLAGGAASAEGQNFKGSTGATVGGTAVTGFEVVSDTEIKFTAPAKTAGTYALAVTNATGTTTKTGAFTYAAS